MFNKFKEINQLLKNIKEISDNPSMVNSDDIFEKIGLDRNFIDKELSEKLMVKHTLKFTKIDDSAVTPKYNYGSDSGFDLHSIEDVEITPFGRKIIRTGLKLEIPERYEIQVRSKSGLALKEGLIVLNSPGTVDQGYTGEIMVIVFNANNTPFKIEKGMKIAQAVLCPVIPGKLVQLHEVVEIKENERGDKGFGSTGIK